jgi:hypothetical protein
MDVDDLYASHAHGDSIDETASFLCRGVLETAANASALGLKMRRKLTGQAVRTAEAKPRPADRTHRWKGRLVPDRCGQETKQ